MKAPLLKHQILPGKPLSDKAAKEALSIFVAVIAIAAALSLWYLRIMKADVPVLTHEDGSERARIAELMQPSGGRPSQADAVRMTQLLSIPKTPPADADRKAIANLMK